MTNFTVLAFERSFLKFTSIHNVECSTDIGFLMADAANGH